MIAAKPTSDFAKVRAELEAEFSPRAVRAKERYAPGISHEYIGGVRCMVVSPPNTASDAVVLYAFGGGFVSGSPEFELPIVLHLAQACHIKFVLPYYSLAPEFPYPTALNEMALVYAELSDKTRGQVVLSGESAGGGLVLSLLPHIQRTGLPAPLAFSLFSPWLDLTETGLSEADRVTDPTIDCAFLREAARAYCGSKAVANLSALQLVRDMDLPPLYLSSGTRDIMRPTLERFASQCQKQGARVTLKVWPDMWHVFELYDDTAHASAALDEAAAFLATALNGH